MHGFELLLGHLLGDYILQNDWMASRKGRNTFACLVHCVFYTLGVALICGSWFPVLGYPVIAIIHFPIDRFGLARLWMTKVSGQGSFASTANPCFPWSIIVVDNIFHLLTLWAVVRLDEMWPKIELLMRQQHYPF